MPAWGTYQVSYLLVVVTGLISPPSARAEKETIVLSLSLIEQWAETMDVRQFAEALVSVAVHEGWACFVDGEAIPWHEWHRQVLEADETVPTRAVLDMAISCQEGTLQGGIINNLDLEACWAFEGTHEAFWRKWGQMLTRYDACPAGSLDSWMAQRSLVPSQQRL